MFFLFHIYRQLNHSLYILYEKYLWGHFFQEEIIKLFIIRLSENGKLTSKESFTWSLLCTSKKFCLKDFQPYLVDCLPFRRLQWIWNHCNSLYGIACIVFLARDSLEPLLPNICMKMGMWRELRENEWITEYLNSTK